MFFYKNSRCIAQEGSGREMWDIHDLMQNQVIIGWTNFIEGCQADACNVSRNDKIIFW